MQPYQAHRATSEPIGESVQLELQNEESELKSERD